MTANGSAESQTALLSAHASTTATKRDGATGRARPLSKLRAPRLRGGAQLEAELRLPPALTILNFRRCLFEDGIEPLSYFTRNARWETP